MMNRTFEFLENKSGEPYRLQTNVYASVTLGKGKSEQRIHLWFDPTKHFHSFGVLWTPQLRFFMVDAVSIRVFKNNKAMGVSYPDNQVMEVYSSLCNGDSWATQGGLVKINWFHAPFIATFCNFQHIIYSMRDMEKMREVILKETSHGL
ncbi:hypothetical protein SUGI_0295000 [Cryptomeria japonica]|uniref:xyloglucan endotransglucosylase/hydrolase 2-like n=1 Tax=Cryptomeria japonica TaxID=3369 RepID=UPI002408C783|nr:xyloglucan endotransglucosylase/hydrolase 2-like [Cryptomeria japonica]GLJ17052.1 hypothetical protein SUGI_0295000 [Cryptomeria japonica]